MSYSGIPHDKSGDYYTGWRAQYYNLFWRTYTRRTLEAAESMIDLPALLDIPQRLGRPSCILDVACGTGILLRWLLEQLSMGKDVKGARSPSIHLEYPTKDLNALHYAPTEAYGVDASEDMLTQARTALKKWPHIHLQRMELGIGTGEDVKGAADPSLSRDQSGTPGPLHHVPTEALPYQPQTFDLITCTNALHYLPDPIATLAALGQLLAPAGQLVLQDYRERELLLISNAFKWLVRRFDPKHVRTYSLEEASSLCTQAGLSIVCQKTFPIDWICNGWALRAYML
jgi:SAM-dependent methyltransferase